MPQLREPLAEALAQRFGMVPGTAPPVASPRRPGSRRSRRSTKWRSAWPRRCSPPAALPASIGPPAARPTSAAPAGRACWPTWLRPGTVQVEGAVGLLGEDQDHQVLDRLGQTHRPRQVDPVPQLAHAGRPAASLIFGLKWFFQCWPSRKTFSCISPSSSGSAIARSSGRSFFSTRRSARWLPRSPCDLLVHLLQVGSLGWGLELRMGRELVLQGLLQQVLHRPLQVRAHRRLRIKPVPKRLEVLASVRGTCPPNRSICRSMP